MNFILMNSDYLKSRKSLPKLHLRYCGIQILKNSSQMKKKIFCAGNFLKTSKEYFKKL